MGQVPHWTFYNHRRPHSSLGGTPRAGLDQRDITANQPDQQALQVAYLTPETGQPKGSSLAGLAFLGPGNPIRA